MKKGAKSKSILSADKVQSAKAIDMDWDNVLEEEETTQMLLSIRDEIVNKAMRICYNKYVEKQAISFTVHCMYISWKKLFDWYFMESDPGEGALLNNTLWISDGEPATSKIDNLCSEAMPIVKHTDKSLDKARSSVTTMPSFESINVASSERELAVIESEPPLQLLYLMDPQHSEYYPNVVDEVFWGSLVSKEGSTASFKAKLYQLRKSKLLRNQKDTTVQQPVAKQLDIALPRNSFLKKLKKRSIVIAPPAFIPVNEMPPYRLDVKYYLYPPKNDSAVNFGISRPASRST